MAFRQDHDRIQPGLLEAGGVEQRQIETGRQFSIENVARAPDLLTGSLKARRRYYVFDPVRGQRGPDCLGDLPRPGLKPEPVAINSRIAARRLQSRSGFAQNHVDSGIIRPHECGE